MWTSGSDREVDQNSRIWSGCLGLPFLGMLTQTNWVAILMDATSWCVAHLWCFLVWFLLARRFIAMSTSDVIRTWHIPGCHLIAHLSVSVCDVIRPWRCRSLQWIFLPTLTLKGLSQLHPVNRLSLMVCYRQSLTYPMSLAAAIGKVSKSWDWSSRIENVDVEKERNAWKNPILEHSFRMRSISRWSCQGDARGVKGVVWLVSWNVRSSRRWSPHASFGRSFTNWTKTNMFLSHCLHVCFWCWWVQVRSSKLDCCWHVFLRSGAFCNILEAFDLIKDHLAKRPDADSTVEWSFNGDQVCLHSFKALCGLGCLALLAEPCQTKWQFCHKCWVCVCTL